MTERIKQLTPVDRTTRLQDCYDTLVDRINREGEIPVLGTKINFPDPCINQDRIYGTEDLNRKVLMQVARLNDKGEFELEERDALARLPATAVTSCWAPAVRTVYLGPYAPPINLALFSSKTKKGFGIFAARSYDLDQQFVPDDEPLVVGPEFQDIDPSLNVDYIAQQDYNGNTILIPEVTCYFGSYMGKPVRKMQLTPYGHMKAGTRVEEVLYPPTENRLYESPQVLSIEGRSTLFVSTDDTSKVDQYRVVSRNLDEKNGGIEHPVLYGDTYTIEGNGDNVLLNWMDPGHQEIVPYKTARGVEYYALYHKGLRSDPAFRVPFMCRLIQDHHGNFVRAK